MGLVVSLILIAVGAILVWGLNAESTDFNVDAHVEEEDVRPPPGGRPPPP